MIRNIFSKKEMINKKICETCAYNVGSNSKDKNIIMCDKHLEYKKNNNTYKYYEWELWKLQSWNFNTK